MAAGLTKQMLERRRVLCRQRRISFVAFGVVEWFVGVKRREANVEGEEETGIGSKTIFQRWQPAISHYFLPPMPLLLFFPKSPHSYLHYHSCSIPQTSTNYDNDDDEDFRAAMKMGYVAIHANANVVDADDVLKKSLPPAKEEV
ncbi:Hypothetical predicted protein [Olea europaea subsp. europaea]|uniref:Uncharacterized protein n=1 Tax=Olea europaea subsp. europaea TaxID=158383 RepID=A0A8S0QSU6_OLEEU|nr:Hypothetical predicted protein [Olea europaea subsp. europaea]